MKHRLAGTDPRRISWSDRLWRYKGYAVGLLLAIEAFWLLDQGLGLTAGAMKPAQAAEFSNQLAGQNADRLSRLIQEWAGWRKEQALREKKRDALAERQAAALEALAGEIRALGHREKIRLRNTGAEK